MTASAPRTARSPFELFLSAAGGDLTDLEAALAEREPAWADFVAHVRSGTNLNRSTRSLRGAGLDTVAEILREHRAAFEGGDRAALVGALRTCCEENVPLPYWLADAILAAFARVATAPVSLHDEFGLGQRLPVRGKRAKGKRRQASDARRLWCEASLLMHDERLSKEAAIARVLEDLALPYQQRTARKMFDEVEQRQRAAIAVRRRGSTAA